VVGTTAGKVTTVYVVISGCNCAANFVTYTVLCEESEESKGQRDVIAWLRELYLEDDNI